MSDGTYKLGRMIISIDTTGLLPYVTGKYPANATPNETELYHAAMKEIEAELFKSVNNAILYGDGKSAIGIQI